MTTVQILEMVIVMLAIVTIVVILGKIRLRRELANLNERIERFAPTIIWKEEGEGRGQQ